MHYHYQETKQPAEPDLGMNPLLEPTDNQPTDQL